MEKICVQFMDASPLIVQKSMSIRVVKVNPEYFKSHHEVASAMSRAKKEAKKTPGNSLFVDRRGNS